MKRTLFPAILLCLLLAGCQPGTPLQVVADPKAKPLDRIAAAETIHNSAITVLILAHQDKAISDATFHKVRLASDAFVAAIASLRASVGSGAVLDGNSVWTAANMALTTILDEKAKAAK